MLLSRAPAPKNPPPNVSDSLDELLALAGVTEQEAASKHDELARSVLCLRREDQAAVFICEL